MKNIKKLFKNHSAYLICLTGFELIMSIIAILAFVYSDSLTYSESLIYNAIGIETLLESLYTSTFWSLILLVLSFTAIFNITAIKYRKEEYSFISLCLWFLMFILSINLTKSLLDNLLTSCLFIPIIIINIIAIKKEKEKTTKKKSKH